MNFPGKNKIRGCIIGQCLGDALGAPAEGMPGDICREYVGGRMEARYRGEDAEIYPGQYTDDSQLPRELMQSYASCGRFDPGDYARRIAAIFEENRIVGRGLATEKAANKLIGGISWREAGCPAPSAGNGSAMRAGPIGLFFSIIPRT